MCPGFAAFLAFGLAALLVGSATAADDLLAAAKQALDGKKYEEAIALADQAITAEPKNAQAYLVRGLAHESLAKHAMAVKDFSRVTELNPKAALAYHHRGCEQFKLAHIPESIADFDRFLELEPKQVPYHWQRGIAYYYAGRYEDGRKQFEVHQTVNPNDVENAVWRYLCMAKTVGVAKARSSLLKIEEDKRVPMMTIYALFAGNANPQDVLKAVEEGQATSSQRRGRLFYAHLYLGLYFEAAGANTEAEKHLREAARSAATQGYMGDVARVHVQLLNKKTSPK